VEGRRRIFWRVDEAGLEIEARDGRTLEAPGEGG
jgi:hypothetical protein